MITVAPSKAAVKAKKKREAKKAKKELEAAAEPANSAGATNGGVNKPSAKNPSTAALADSNLPDDPEKRKAVKKIQSVSGHFNRIRFNRLNNDIQRWWQN